jgi:hypothetical protein
MVASAILTVMTKAKMPLEIPARKPSAIDPDRWTVTVSVKREIPTNTSRDTNTNEPEMHHDNA